MSQGRSTTGTPKPNPCIPWAPGTGAGKRSWPPGTYEYRLVVDGQWTTDPMAKETVPNPFGGRNSVLKVASSPEAAHLADAENLPMKNTNEQIT